MVTFNVIFNAVTGLTLYAAPSAGNASAATMTEAPAGTYTVDADSSWAVFQQIGGSPAPSDPQLTVNVQSLVNAAVSAALSEVEAQETGIKVPSTSPVVTVAPGELSPPVLISGRNRGQRVALVAGAGRIRYALDVGRGRVTWKEYTGPFMPSRRPAVLRAQAYTENRVSGELTVQLQG